MRDGPLSIASPLSISKRALSRAVHRNKAATSAGMLERCFTFAFKSLVYPQIWEDPAVDMAALALGPDSRIVTIASGGCNVLAYLTADPAQITAVDLNRAHIALTRIKVAAALHLPDYDSLLPVLRRGRPQGQSLWPTSASCARGSTPTRSPTGRAGTSPAAAGSRCSRAISTTTACSATRSASAT